MTDDDTTVLLTDPELALEADARLTGDLRVLAVGGHLNGSYSSLRQLLEHRRQVERTLRANMTKDQRRVSPPCCVIYKNGELLIYGEVIDPAMAFTMELMAGGTPDEARMFRRRVANALGRNWLWGKWYSTVVPDGELGAVHRSQIGSVISRGAFDVAKASGWGEPWVQRGKHADDGDTDDTAASGESDDSEKG